MKTKRDPSEAISEGSLLSLGRRRSKLDSLNPKVQPQEPSKTFGCGAIIAGSLGFVNLGVFCPRGLWIKAEDSHLSQPGGLSRDVHRHNPANLSVGNVPGGRVVPHLDAPPG